MANGDTVGDRVRLTKDVGTINAGSEGQVTRIIGPVREVEWWFDPTCTGLNPRPTTQVMAADLAPPQCGGWGQ